MKVALSALDGPTGLSHCRLNVRVTSPIRAGVQLINYLKALDLQTALTAHIEGINAFGALTNRPCERYF